MRRLISDSVTGTTATVCLVCILSLVAISSGWYLVDRISDYRDPRSYESQQRQEDVLIVPSPIVTLTPTPSRSR